MQRINLNWNVWNYKHIYSDKPFLNIWKNYQNIVATKFLQQLKKKVNPLKIELFRIENWKNVKI